jgi:phosphoglycerate dehydrogenase-like enzyme
MNDRTDTITIVAFASQNPDRQADLRAGVRRLMGDRPYRLHFPADEAAAVQVLPGAEILMTWRLSEALFRAGKDLKWVHNGNAGVERSLFPDFVESDIVLTNVSGIHGTVIAEWTLASLFYLAQRFHDVDEWRADRDWKQHKEPITRQRFTLEGKSALVVGYGRVGQATAEKLKAIGIRCEAIATQAKPSAVPVHGVEKLAELVGRFDIVFIALPITPQTDQLFSREILQRMKPGSILVNVARGRIIDEAALIDSLQNGPLAYAALDVFTEEPLPPSSPLFDLSNAFLSPHISGNFPEYTHRVQEMFLDNLERYIEGKPLVNVVDKRRGY